jgi:hypothetical protein
MVSVSLINIALVDLGVIIWIYYYFKCKKIEERITKLEKLK